MATNALKLRDCIQLHREGNSYIVGKPLKNVISSMVIPDTAKLNILQRDQKGQSKHKTFAGERILAGSATSIWDPMNKLKLKTHSTWMAKQKTRAARFLVIQQSRPELVPKLPYTIGDYEMSVVPRSVFANDGSLLIPTDKSIVVHAVESLGDFVDVPAENSDEILTELSEANNSRSESTIVIDGTKYEEDIWNDQDSSSEDCFF